MPRNTRIPNLSVNTAAPVSDSNRSGITVSDTGSLRGDGISVSMAGMRIAGDGGGSAVRTHTRDLTPSARPYRSTQVARRRRPPPTRVAPAARAVWSGSGLSRTSVYWARGAPASSSWCGTAPRRVGGTHSRLSRWAAPSKSASRSLWSCARCTSARPNPSSAGAPPSCPDPDRTLAMVPTLTPTPDPEPHPAIPAPTPPLTRNSGVTPNIIALHDACTHTARAHLHCAYAAPTPHVHRTHTPHAHTACLAGATRPTSSPSTTPSMPRARCML